MSLILTNENYYTMPANIDYMSVSQFKDFAGSQGKKGCEACALAKLNGTYTPATNTALLVGSYVDSYFEGTLDEFKTNNPEIFKKTGDKGLKADYVLADKIIDRINRDGLFSQYMAGKKQQIMSAELFGIDWKIKMDSYHSGEKIVDLKIMKNLEPTWSNITNSKLDFIRYYGYDIQGAVYQAVVEKVTGKKLPFYLAVATKEASPNIEIIQITQPYLDAALDFVHDNINRVIDVKTGIAEDTNCNECDFCHETKIINGPITIEDIIPKNYYLNTEE